MIISASRRTDIPSCYSAWFINRLREGFVLVEQPYRAHHLTRLALSPETVDCIVFWTKDPAPMEGRLSEISDLGYPFYFQFTLTPYGKRWETHLPVEKRRIETFRRLSRTIGKERMVWRYDPIILDDATPVSYHIEQFGRLCEALHPYTDQCVISFVDAYAHNRHRIPPISGAQMHTMAKALSGIAASHNLQLSACCEALDLTDCGVSRASCIDRDRIERLVGCSLRVRKDTGQRPACGCVESVDIGSYGTCLNGCLYCYATRSRASAQQRYAQHDPRSPLLTGWPRGDEQITKKQGVSLKAFQTSLFDIPL